MHRSLHNSGNIDTKYVLRKEGGRRLACIKDSTRQYEKSMTTLRLY